MKVRKRERRVEENKRIKIKSIRLTEGELDFFKKKSVLMGLDVSATIRELALKSNVKITSKTDQETKLQLKRIGVNINQVVRVINSVHEESEIKKQLDVLEDFLQMVRNIIRDIDK